MAFMLLGVFGVWGRGGVGATLEGGPLGVNSLAPGFSENSFALGLRVDFFTLSVLVLGVEGVSAATGMAGDEAGGGAPPGVSWPAPGWGEGRGVLPWLAPLCFTLTRGVELVGDLLGPWLGPAASWKLSWNSLSSVLCCSRDFLPSLWPGSS